MTKYHKNKLPNDQRYVFLQEFYYPTTRSAHSFLRNYNTVSMLCSLGLVLVWLEELSLVENFNSEDIEIVNINTMMDYIIDVGMYTAYNVSVHPLEIENYHNRLLNRLPNVAYTIENHYENNIEEVTKCFKETSLYISNHLKTHLKMVTFIAFICTDYVRFNSTPRDKIDFNVLMDVFATVLYIANKLSNERKPSYDFSHLLSGTGKKDSGSI